MGEQTLGIRIKIDSDTGKLTVLNKEFDSLGKSSAQASSQLSSFDGTMAAINTRMVALVAAGYTAKSVFDMTVGSGIALNSQFEQMKLGIASLIAVNSSNTTAMGHSISTVQKFQMAQAQAAESVDLLRKANLQTPATLAQITEGYQAALGPSLRLGMSTKQTVEYVKLMTMAAAAMGQPMEQIAQESRALLSGEIDMNAQVARNLQITNEQIKMHTKQGDLYEFLTKKLGDFAAGGEAMSNSWEGISSNITDSIQTIQQKATEGIFDALKADGIDLQHKLSDNANEIADAFAHGFSNAYLVAAPAAENIYLAFEVSLSSINVLLNSFTDMFDTSVDGMNNKYRELGFFDYLSLGFIVAIEGFRQLGDVGLSVITFLGSMMNKFQSITLDAFAGIAGGMGALTDLVGLDGSSFYESQAYWVKKSNAVKQDGLLIDQTQKAILGDMGKGVDRLAHSYNQLALVKDKPTRPGSNDSLTPAEQAAAAKTAAELAKEKAAAKKAESERLKVQQAYDSMAKESYKSSHNEYENSIRDIEDKGKTYLAQGIKQIDVDKYVNGAKSDLKKKYTDKADAEALAAIKTFNDDQAKLEFQADQDRESALKTFNNGQISAQIDYYTAIGDTSSAYYLQEEEKMKKLAETGWYTNEQMLAIKTADNDKFQKEQWKKDNVYWVDLFDNIGKAMDDQFFNAMTGKFTSFGDWLKDMWSSLTNSLARGLSKSLADSIMGTGTSGGGIQNLFKSYGGLGSVFGTSMAPASLMGAVTDSAGFTTTTGGTVFDAAGQITLQGKDYTSVLSDLSNAKSIYGLATNGITGYMGGIAGNLANAAGWLNGVGFTAGGNFLTGAGSIFAGNGMLTSSTASMLGGGLAAGALGGVGGYALGSLGDKLFGSNTRAGEYGAIGGSLGAVIGSVVPGIGTLIGGIAGSVLGSVIGGMFGGGTSATGSGINVKNLGAYDTSNIQAYTSWHEDGGWFSSDSNWNTFDPLSTAQKTSIKGTFDAYNYLLEQLGSSGKVFAKSGLYSSEAFSGSLAKSFITLFTGVQETIIRTSMFSWGSYANPEFKEIYAYWTDYAKAVNKTVAEALTTSVGEYITTTRSFNEWKLGSGTAEQLKFTADYLTKDLASLEAQMGVSGITIDNYLAEYDKAIKAQFTPETITTWKSLGDALISATDANTKYTDSLKELTKVTLKPADMMLGKVNDATRTTQGETLNTQLLVQIVKALKSIQSTNQFSASGGLV